MQIVAKGADVDRVDYLQDPLLAAAITALREEHQL
jgi:hypothetical protein